MSDSEDYTQSGSVPADSETDEASAAGEEKERTDEDGSGEKHPEEEEQEKKLSSEEGKQAVIDRLQDGTIAFPDGFTTDDLKALISAIDVPSEFNPEAIESYHQDCANIIKEELVGEPEKPEDDDEDVVRLTPAFIAERLSDLQPVEGEHLSFAFTCFAVQEANIYDIAALSDFQALLFVRMKTNIISDASGLSGLPRLRELYLPENKLVTFSDISLPALEILDLSQNQLRSLGRLQLPKLKKLILFQNPITFVSPNAFAETLQLEEINFNENKLKQFKPDTFKPLAQLKTLKMDQNRFVTLSEGMFDGLTSITALSLAENQIEAIPALCALATIETLDLRQTALTNLEDLKPLIDVKGLKTFLVDGSSVCTIEAFKSEMILLLPWLEVLDEETISFADRQEAITLDEERKAEAERQRKEAEEAAAEREAAGETGEKEPESGGEESTGDDGTESYATYESDDK
jgi:hypothetical protein